MKRLTENNINTPQNFDDLSVRILERDNGRFDYSSGMRTDIMLRYYRGGKLLEMCPFTSPLCEKANYHYPDADITILDFSPKVIEYFGRLGYVKTVLSDCRETPFKDETFDYITAGEILEHLEKPEEMVKEMIRILKPNGIFVVSTPLEEEPGSNLGGGFHLWSYTEEDIKNLLKSFSKIEIEQLFHRDRYNIIAICFKGRGGDTS